MNGCLKGILILLLFTPACPLVVTGWIIYRLSKGASEAMKKGRIKRKQKQMETLARNKANFTEILNLIEAGARNADHAYRAESELSGFVVQYRTNELRNSTDTSRTQCMRAKSNLENALNA